MNQGGADRAGGRAGAAGGYGDLFNANFAKTDASALSKNGSLDFGDLKSGASVGGGSKGPGSPGQALLSDNDS